jgi:hypothetical protein
MTFYHPVRQLWRWHGQCRLSCLCGRCLGGGCLLRLQYRGAKQAEQRAANQHGFEHLRLLACEVDLDAVPAAGGTPRGRGWKDLLALTASPEASLQVPDFTLLIQRNLMCALEKASAYFWFRLDCRLM